MASGVLSQPMTLAATGTARWMTRHLRLAVPLLIDLICGSFAAAALPSSSAKRHAQALADQRAFMKAAEPPVRLAAVTGAALDRFAQAGAVYAGDPAAPLTLPGLLNVAVFDAQRRGHRPRCIPTARCRCCRRRRCKDSAPCSASEGRKRRWPLPAAGQHITWCCSIRLFSTARLAQRPRPRSPGGSTILGEVPADAALIAARVPGWPLTASAAIASDDASPRPGRCR